jgi:type II secretory pathway pseudopilin PulG
LKEAGFSYIESLLALCLLVLLMAAVTPVLESLEHGREDRKNETEGYLLARTAMERWKAGEPASVSEEKIIGGKAFGIEANVLPITAMVEKCEVTVQWKSRTHGPKKYTLTGYRFIPGVSVPSSTSLTTGHSR